jgi:hypothetical protein
MTTLTPEAQQPPYDVAGFTLPTWCDAALDCVIHQYEHGYSAGAVPLPGRKYWTIGQTAHDCEQMVLCVQQMFLGTSAMPLETSQCNGPRSLTFTVEVVRCVPGLNNRGQPPAALAIQAASVDPVVDMEILMDCAHCFDPFNVGIVATIDVIPAGGGMHGAIGTYTATL